MTRGQSTRSLQTNLFRKAVPKQKNFCGYQKLTERSFEMATIADGGQPKASVLLIVGEPFSDGDKTLILEEIVKGK